MAKNVKVEARKAVVNGVELPVGKFLTEKGMVKAAVRENLKEQVMASEINLNDWELANDNTLLMPLVQDVNGQTVSARIALTITAKEEFYTEKKKEQKEEKVEIPKLF